MLRERALRNSWSRKLSVRASHCFAEGGCALRKKRQHESGSRDCFKKISYKARCIQSQGVWVLSPAFLLNDLEQITYPQWVPVSHLPKEVTVLFTPGLLDGLNEILCVKCLARNEGTHTKGGHDDYSLGPRAGWVFFSPLGPSSPSCSEEQSSEGLVLPLLLTCVPAKKKRPLFSHGPKGRIQLCVGVEKIVAFFAQERGPFATSFLFF